MDQKEIQQVLHAGGKDSAVAEIGDDLRLLRTRLFRGLKSAPSVEYFAEGEHIAIVYLPEEIIKQNSIQAASATVLHAPSDLNPRA
jgi:hypothetical protein